MERFWLRPRWLIGTVIALGLVMLFANLGFWQLRRLDDRRHRNALIESRAEASPAPLVDVVEPDADIEAGKDVAYRRVTATGTYDGEGQVLIRPRTEDGQPGFHVVAPLVLDDGSAVLVNRGFVPGVTTDDMATALRETTPPAGEVEVSGLALATQERLGVGPTDDPDVRLDVLARIDVDRLRQQYDAALYPVYVQLERQLPAGGELPVLLDPPVTDEGPHLGYAVQWFLFAGVGIVGWPILLRRTGQERARERARDGSGAERNTDRDRQPQPA